MAQGPHLVARHGLLIHSPFEEHVFCEASQDNSYKANINASSTCIQGWSFLFNEFGILFWTNFSYLVCTLFGIPEIYFNVKGIPEYILYILRIVQDIAYDFRKCPFSCMHVLSHRTNLQQGRTGLRHREHAGRWALPTNAKQGLERGK